MNPSTPKTASMVSLTDDLEELDWCFEDIFDQFGNVYCLFSDINHLLVNYPLEFLLFEIQQLVSFYVDTENACHSHIPSTIVCPISYHVLL